MVPFLLQTASLNATVLPILLYRADLTAIMLPLLLHLVNLTSIMLHLLLYQKWGWPCTALRAKFAGPCAQSVSDQISIQNHVLVLEPSTHRYMF